jgi:hypothetical protein
MVGMTNRARPGGGIAQPEAPKRMRVCKNCAMAIGIRNPIVNPNMA